MLFCFGRGGWVNFKRCCLGWDFHQFLWFFFVICHCFHKFSVLSTMFHWPLDLDVWNLLGQVVGFGINTQLVYKSDLFDGATIILAVWWEAFFHIDQCFECSLMHGLEPWSSKKGLPQSFSNSKGRSAVGCCVQLPSIASSPELNIPEVTLNYQEPH